MEIEGTIEKMQERIKNTFRKKEEEKSKVIATTLKTESQRSVS